VTAEPAALRVRHLAKAYGRLEAVQDLSFAVHPGEVVGLLGPNGAGKTSAIECIAGLRQPDGGEILIGGIDAASNRRLANRRLGIALQATGLQDQITPREAIHLFAALYVVTPEADDLLDRFGLAAKADARFATLSGGQRQRLALALAFINDPAVLILDEPTVGLDPAIRAELHEHIAAMRRDGRAILLATHDMQEAQALCDRLLVIHQGRLVAQGSPQELIGSSLSSAILQVQTSAPPAHPPLPPLTLLSAADCELRLEAAELTAGLGELARWLAAQDIRLIDIQIARPGLADIIVQLTGR